MMNTDVLKCKPSYLTLTMCSYIHGLRVCMGSPIRLSTRGQIIATNLVYIYMITPFSLSFSVCLCVCSVQSTYTADFLTSCRFDSIFCIGFNQFTSDGNTPTGLAYLDMNTREQNASLYGPFPIQRVVRGIQGNAQLLLPNIRDGVLMHTGEWPQWDVDMQMPNSAGCIHTHPTDLDTVNTIATQYLGVTVNPNPYSGRNYPYSPQGIISIVRIPNNKQDMTCPSDP